MTARYRIVFLLIAGSLTAHAQEAVPTATPPAQRVMQIWFDANDSQWQGVLKREVTDGYAAEVLKLKQVYEAALEAALNKASSAGDLDGALALRDEKKRLAENKPFWEQDEGEAAPSVKELRAAIRPQFARLESDRIARTRVVHARYDEFLAGAQAQLTQHGRLDDAQLVKKKREEIASLWLPPASKAASETAKATPLPVATVHEKAKPLAKFLPDTKWAWQGSKDHLLLFRKDGTVSLDFWGTNPTKWRVKGSNQVVFIMHVDNTDKTATITFTDDRSSFSGTQFRGTPIAKSPRVEAEDGKKTEPSAK